MQIIDGKRIASDIYVELEKKIAQLSFVPIFCDIIVGDDPSSLQYAKMKASRADKLGLEARVVRLDYNATESTIIQAIQAAAAETRLRGLIVQLPLPSAINTQAILNAVPPGLDIDCLGQINGNAFYSGKPQFTPPTVAAIMNIISSTVGSPQGKPCAVIGQGLLVGKPVSFLLEQSGASRVHRIDSKTPNPRELTRQADILISAAGKPGLVDASWVKPGCLLIDAGTAENGSAISGDVDNESLAHIPGWLAPVPGGVGPLTVAKLMANLILATTS